MKYEKIISEILAGLRDVEELPFLEKEYPGIISEYNSARELIGKIIPKEEYKLDEIYFSDLPGTVENRREKSLHFYRFGIGGLSFAVVILIAFLLLPKKADNSGRMIFSGNEAELSILEDDEIFSSIENEILSENRVVSEMIPDSLLTNVVFENVKSASLVDYIFQNSLWESDTDIFTAENELADLY